MASVYVVDLACLACGRGRQVTVTAMANLPPMPERCEDCRGSVLAVSSTERHVYETGYDWSAERPRRGRRPAHPKQMALELERSEQTV